MKCIFCKSPSLGNKSKEHIIPESLGSPDHILPVGVVCDSCNQYFARKIERPLLETSLFSHIRSIMKIPNKRGRIPSWDINTIELPPNRLMGRFLAKAALEIMAFKTLSLPSSNEEIVNKPELDELRRFARFNEGEDWPFTFRTLHPINAIFHDQDTQECYELLNEFDILMTANSEFYSVLSLFGVELVINLGGRQLDGYRAWLESNNYSSPLWINRDD